MMIDPLGIVILLGVFAVLIIIKLPVAFCLAFSAFITAFYMNIPISAITQKMVASLDSFSLLAIPFFILAGEIMGAGGISDRIFNLANVLVGRVKGGMAMVNALDSVFFGMISGSAIASVSSMGPIEIRMMQKQGYPTPFAVALSCTSACIAIITPPSHNMIIYASIAGGAVAGGVSVGKLFMAGLIPGYLLCLLLLIYCYIIARVKNFPKGDTFTFKQSMKIVADSFLGLFTVVIIIGGVFAGIVTANESAVLACIWALFVALLVYKGIKVKDLLPLLKKTLKTIALVMTLIASAGAFGFMMTTLRIPELVASGLFSISNNKYVLLLLINIALLAMGTIMDLAPLILISAPILIPVVTSPLIGLDPVHFGIVMIFNLSMGLLTPPVGTVLFVGSAIGKIRIEETIKALLPFYVVMFAALMLVTYIPAISMFIPNLMFGK
ncbi:MAG: TRAP transporter large permease [Treponema sp.]|nr:TRAP transporter large permease [Treponema sp.]